MLNLGIVGTSIISKNFAEAAVATGLYSLVSVYSRNGSTGRAFANSFMGMKVYTDYAEFVSSSEVQIIYIASPNSLHYEHACEAIKAGKHVIIEKPAFLSGNQAGSAFDLANKHGVLLFEAARHIHEKNFIRLVKIIHSIGDIKGANFHMMGYSSRYDAVLAGKEPNIFSLQYGGGALYDLGIYLVYAAVSFFGNPLSQYYYCTKVCTGVDGMGTLLFRYKGFDVVMQTSKIVSSHLTSEIYSTASTLEIDAITNIGSITRYDRIRQTSNQLALPKAYSPLSEELVSFAEIIQGMGESDIVYRYNYLKILCCNVHNILELLRVQTGIEYPI